MPRGRGAAAARDDGRAPVRRLPAAGSGRAAPAAAAAVGAGGLDERAGRAGLPPARGQRGLLGALQARQSPPGGAPRGADRADLRRRDPGDDARAPGAGARHAARPLPGGRARLPPAGPRRRACAGRRRSGPPTAALVAALLDEPTLTRLREVQALLRLGERYPPSAWSAPAPAPRAAGDGRYRTVRGILERELDSLALDPEPPPQTAGAFLRGPAAFAARRPTTAEAVAGC